MDLVMGAFHLLNSHRQDDNIVQGQVLLSLEKSNHNRHCLETFFFFFFKQMYGLFQRLADQTNQGN